MYIIYFQKELYHLVKQYLPLFNKKLILFDYFKQSILIVNNDINELFEERIENLYDYYTILDSNDSFYLDPSFLFIDKKNLITQLKILN